MPPNSKLAMFNSGQSWGGDLRNVSSPRKQCDTLNLPGACPPAVANEWSVVQVGEEGRAERVKSEGAAPRTSERGGENE